MTITGYDSALTSTQIPLDLEQICCYNSPRTKVLTTGYNRWRRYDTPGCITFLSPDHPLRPGVRVVAYCHPVRCDRGAVVIASCRSCRAHQSPTFQYFYP